MSYGAYLVRHPLFWALVVGMAVGAAGAFATRRTSRACRPDRAQARKWALTWLALSLGVAALAAGTVIPDGLRLFSLRALWMGLGALVVVGLALRFPRAAGIPVIVLAGTAVVLGAWTVRDMQPLRTQAELARVTVLSVRDGGLSLEVTVSGTHPREQESAEDGGLVSRVVTVGSRSLRVQADAVDVADPLILLGARRFVRYSGPGAPRSDASSPALAFALEHGLAGSTVLEATVERVNVLRTYRFVVGPDAPARLVRVEQ